MPQAQSTEKTSRNSETSGKVESVPQKVAAGLLMSTEDETDDASEAFGKGAAKALRALREGYAGGQFAGELVGAIIPPGAQHGQENELLKQIAAKQEAHRKANAELSVALFNLLSALSSKEAVLALGRREGWFGEAAGDGSGEN